MQRLKKISISLCIAILLFNIVSPVLVTMAASKEPYDHNELLQYPGYGEAMYQTVVEETAYITGQYTENKDFVSKTIDEIKDYAKFWGNEFNEFVKADSLRDAIERGGGLLLTVGDWFKKLFTDYGDEYYPPDDEGWSSNPFVISDPRCAKEKKYCNYYEVKKGYVMKINNTYSLDNSDGFAQFGVWSRYYRDNLRTYQFTVYGFTSDAKILNESAMELYESHHTGQGGSNGNFSTIMSIASSLGVSITFETTGAPGVPVKPTPSPTPYDDFRKNVQEKVNNIAIPEPRPYLSCPNGTKIQMSVSGSTFLGVNGKAMIVNKDGTAQVDSAICQLNWDKPTVKYIDGRTVIETPGKGYKDVETNEQVVPDKNPVPGEDGEDGEGEDEEGEDGECGTLCALGKLTKFLLNFFEKLLDFFIKIFIPEDTDFLTNEFDKLKKVFDEKFKIVGSLEKTMSDFFVQENTNPLSNLSINLPATGGRPIDVMPTTFVEQHVPTLKKVMSGFIVIMTIFYVYRKITGRGGVMEK